MDRKQAGKLGWEKTKALHEENYQKRLAAYKQDPKKCRLCDALIKYEKRANDYCSRSCSTAYNNGRRGGNIAAHPCLICGETIVNRKRRKYCSHTCRGKAKWIELKLQIQGTGVVPVSDDSTGRKYAKKYLVELKGHSCEICRNDTWIGQPIPLVLDHINGNAADWQITNLRLVCGNCNMQLPTFAGRNKGKGRAWRRKRYALGLSS